MLAQPLQISGNERVVALLRQVHHHRYVPEHPQGVRWKYTPPLLAGPRPVAVVEQKACRPRGCLQPPALI